MGNRRVVLASSFTRPDSNRNGPHQSVSVLHGNALASRRSRQPAVLRFRAPTGATGRRLRGRAALAAGRGRGLSHVRQERTRLWLIPTNLRYRLRNKHLPPHLVRPTTKGVRGHKQWGGSIAVGDYLRQGGQYSMPIDAKENAMRPNRKGPLALAVLALVMLASGAAWTQTADDRVTAGQVVDDETLKAFVEGAAAEIAAITDVAVGGRLRDRFRTDPDWNHGSMFLILFTQSGNPFIHGNDRTAENRDLLDVEDDNGFRVVEALLAAGARGRRLRPVS